MKYVVFLTGLLLVVPVSTMAASYSKRIQEAILALVVFGTGFTDICSMTFMPSWWYAGSTRGFEISIVDLLAVVLLLSTLERRRREGVRLFWPASLGMMIVYLGYSCFSVATSEPKLFGLFEISKFLRGIVVFLGVAWYVRSKRDVQIIVCALAAVLLYNGCLGVMQRYLWSGYRVRGTFSHSNMLGDYCCLTGPVVLAAVFAEFGLPVRAVCAAAWASASVATVLTISRMPSAIFVVSSGVVLMAGLGRQIDAKKIAVVLLLGAVACGAFYRGLHGLKEREAAETAMAEGNPDGGRGGQYRMGMKMAGDHIFGVGLNNWGWFYHEYCYLAGDDSGKPYASTEDPGDGKATQGHTVFGMTLGELGWPGLLIFLLLWFRWLGLSGRFPFMRDLDFWSVVGTGCFVGFCAEFLANLTEITFRLQGIVIIFNVMIGFVIAARRMRSAY